jgi:hypothetical protein
LLHPHCELQSDPFDFQQIVRRTPTDRTYEYCLGLLTNADDLDSFRPGTIWTTSRLAEKPA